MTLYNIPCNSCFFSIGTRCLYIFSTYLPPHTCIYHNTTFTITQHTHTHTVDERSLSDKARGHYNAAVHSKPRGDGKIPNVIRAYYAAYAPNPSFRPPKKVTPVPVPTPLSVFSSTSDHFSVDMKDSQAGQLNSKRSYSEANNHNNNHNNSNNLDFNNSSNRNNEFNSKVEVYESKKYSGKFYMTDPKTNAAVWIEIISKFENNNNTNHNNNNNNDSMNKEFNMHSNIDNFYFIDPKNSLKIGISKAHFIPK
jgi:hypothetical protein